MHNKPVNYYFQLNIYIVYVRGVTIIGDAMNEDVLILTRCKALHRMAIIRLILCTLSGVSLRQFNVTHRMSFCHVIVSTVVPRWPTSII